VAVAAAETVAVAAAETVAVAAAETDGKCDVAGMITSGSFV